MYPQRRRPSRLTKEDREERARTVEIKINNSVVKESTSLKTLGVRFDCKLNFRDHWSQLTNPVLKQIRGISEVSKHLSFLERKQLGVSLVISKIAYCLEITSSGQRSFLITPKKLMNNLARTVCREWNYENMRSCYHQLGWSTMEEMCVNKIYLLARKIIAKNDPRNILEHSQTEQKMGGR